MTEDLGAAQLRAQRILPTIAHVVLLGVVFLMIRDVPNAAASFLPWAAVVVLIMLARTILWGRLARASPRAISLVVRSTMLVLGLAWGVGTALLSRVVPPVVTSLMLLGLAGLLAGALTTLMSDRWAFTVYAVALFLPVAVTLAGWGNREMRTSEILLLAIYVIFTNRLHAQAHTMPRRASRDSWNASIPTTAPGSRLSSPRASPSVGQRNMTGARSAPTEKSASFIRATCW